MWALMIASIVFTAAESGLGLVVPVLQGDPANPWAFLYPFTASMWALMIASIVFTAAVIWYLEHNQNLDFGGGPYHHQLTTSLWFSFASMVRSQEQHVGTVLGRFVVISWLFVVLIVTCSYTANLTSILTVNNLTPPVQSLAAVITSGSVVGYLNGSFSEQHLLGFGVRRKQLQALNSVDEYAQAMLNGTVVGVVDERPFLDLILSKDCSFTTGEADISTLGWAFAFQKGSNLAVDLSKAIAQLSESGVLRTIHNNYVPHNLTCSGDASGASSESLGAEGFQNLFILYGVMATFACLMYLAVLLYRGHLAKKELEEEGEEVSGGMSAIKAKPWMNPFKHFIYLYNLGVAWSIARNIEIDDDEPFYEADPNMFEMYDGTSFNQSEFTNGTDEGPKHDHDPDGGRKEKDKSKGIKVSKKSAAVKPKKQDREGQQSNPSDNDSRPRGIQSEGGSCPRGNRNEGSSLPRGGGRDAAAGEILPARLLPSQIKNKQKRSAVTAKLRAEKEKGKKQRLKRRRQEEERAVALGEAAPPRKVARTIDSTREVDETIAQPDDDELHADEAQDEFAPHFNRERPPKVLITTCQRIHPTMKQFIKELLVVIPGSEYYERRQYRIKEIVQYASARDYTAMIVINENRNKPNALMLIGLPEGPTALFKLSSLVLRKDIKNAGRATSHLPELILNNFSTRLGHRVGRLLASLFPQDPEFKGRRVVTLHNQRDFIFFRHHRRVVTLHNQRDFIFFRHHMCVAEHA
ncbi:unnamed protein product [Closterium sp. Yama58-4]|nr:unnamed protein product [Closterium sp. Yama58-4]